MKTQKIVIGAALAFALASGAAAQQTGSTTSSSQQGQGKEVKVTGCLQSAQAGLGGATTSSGDRFILTNAMMSSGSSSTSTGGATTTKPSTGAGATSSTGTGTTYLLEGKTSDLRQHLNQQVEVTGKLESPSTTGSTTGGQRTEPSTGSARLANAQRLQVESVRMIASSCTK